MIRKSRILISLFLIGATVLTGLSINKVPFLKFENVNTAPSLNLKSNITLGLDQICVDYKDTGNNNINNSLPSGNQCADYKDANTVVNGPIGPVIKFLEWYHKAYVVLVIALSVLSLQCMLMVVSKNGLNSFVAYIIRSILITGVILMFLCLLISPVILKNAMGLDNDKLKESGVDSFDGIILSHKHWDLGVIFLLVITGLLMISTVIFNVTKK